MLNIGETTLIAKKTIDLLKLLDMASVSSVLYHSLYKNLERNP